MTISFWSPRLLTYEAYNVWGGKSAYGGANPGGVAALKVSFNRPKTIVVVQDILKGEYNAMRYLERNGYLVTYVTDVDLHEGNVTATNNKIVVEMGHNEYYSREMRLWMQAARDAGVSLGFFSANTMFWQIRYEPSTIDGTADRNIVIYRDPTLDPDYKIPADWPVITTKWRNAPVSWPGRTLAGRRVLRTRLVVPDDIVVTDASHWTFAGTGLANGDHIPGLAGGEVDNNTGLFAPITILAHTPVFGYKSNAPEIFRHDDLHR